MEWKEAFALSLINHRAPSLAFLCWALDVEVRTIVEVGVNKGETSQFLRHLFPTCSLFLVDPWKLTSEYGFSGTPISRKNAHYEKAYRHVASFFRNDLRATILRMTSQEAVHCVPDEIDLVFIDANHEYLEVKRDILAWLPKVRCGGVLAGHDYDQNIPMFSGVKHAVDEVFGRDILLGKDRIWVHFRKTNARGGTRTPTSCLTTTSK